MSGLKRIGMRFAVAVFILAMSLTIVIPAFAQVTNFVLVPEQQVTVDGFTVPIREQTLTCEDVTDPIDDATCTFVDFGNVVPADLVCDIPATLVANIFGVPTEVEVFQCRTVESAPAPAPITAPQITQEGEQEAEAGEIDQTSEVS